MKKVKDLMALLFWGVVGGAFFVGSILGMGHLLNQIVDKLPISKDLCLSLLVLVMIGSLKVIAWLWAKRYKQRTKEATDLLEKVFIYLKKPR